MRWRVTWPRRRAGSWCCWPSSMSGGAGRSWEMSSCAAWLSWKCQMSSGTAREHVRVARALRDLPVIRAEFAAARLSYAKVRALTRIATPATEGHWRRWRGPMTGNQLERFARAHRQCSRADDAAARVRRRLTWRFEEDGSLAGPFRLPPLDGAVLLKALRVAAADMDAARRAGRFRGNAARSGGPGGGDVVGPGGCARWWWRSRSWPGRWPGPMTRRSTRSSSTSGPMWSRPAGVSAETPPPSRPPMGSGRIRPGATSRTAPRSASPPRR